MVKLVMGFWDCWYCDTQHIEGTVRDCPNCSRPRGEGVKFYMDKKNIQYLTPKESKNKGKGADWLCPYCNSLNSILTDTCTSCGASKQESKMNYFEMHQDNPKKVVENKPKTVTQENSSKKVVKENSSDKLFFERPLEESIVKKQDISTNKEKDIKKSFNETFDKIK